MDRRSLHKKDDGAARLGDPSSKAGTKPATPPESQTKAKEKISKKATPVDALFELESPGYYVFGDFIHTRKCYVCDKEFTTRLELNNFCSPDHKQYMLRKLAGEKQ